MKVSKTKLILLWGIALLPVVMTALLYSQLPDQIPTHWGINGQVNDWASKSTYIFTVPFIGVAITALLLVLPRLDPRRANYEKFSNTYYWLAVFVTSIHAIFNGIALLTAMKYDIATNTIVKLLVGILFALFGNLLPKVKHNYFVGIKTPWTLASEDVWFTTHRLAGLVWFISGLVMIAASFISATWATVIYASMIGISVVVPIVYSYFSFQGLKKS